MSPTRARARAAGPARPCAPMWQSLSRCEHERESTHEGKRGHRRGGNRRRMQALLRIPHHPADRGGGIHVQEDAEDRRCLSAGRVRSRVHQHGPRCRSRRRQGHDVHILPRHQPDGRGDLLSGGIGRSVPDRQRPARRARTRRNPALPGGLLPGDQIHRPPCSHPRRSRRPST